MKETGYAIHLEPEPEGGYTVTVPAIPEIVTYGETIEESLEMARDAIECHHAAMAQLGLPVPLGEDLRRPLDALVVVPRTAA